MTRVHGRHASAVPSAADRHRRVDQRKKASYKIILEEVADKQKKLKTVLYPEQKAPRGYTFIPAGDPQLTNRCKKLARDDGFTVFIVSTSRHLRQGLSREIHRVGFHFPSVTVEKACDSLGVTLSNSGRVLQSNFAHLEDGQEHEDKRSTKQKKQKVGNRNAQPALDVSLPQAVIDTSARETIRDLFPNIPNQDLHAIVGRSFQKGKGHVGTVANLSLVRRAQLAVIAHIRHTYTEYDALLKQVQYNEARRRVEKPCLDRLIRWRGDDDDTGDMEDVLREVIVIPDDDEDDNDGRDETKDILGMRPGERERDSSVEYISEAEMQVQPVDYSNVEHTAGRGDSFSPVSDKEIQYLGRNKLHHGHHVQYSQHTLDRMGTHRQRVYKEALDRRRKYPENLDVHNDHSSLSVFASSGHHEVHPLSQQPHGRDRPSHLTEWGEQGFGPAPTQTRIIPIVRPDGYRADPYSNSRDPRYGLEEQVAYPSQRDRRVLQGDTEQPKRVYHAGDDQFLSSEIQSSELQQHPNRIFDLDERFASQNNTGQGNGDSLHLREFGAQSRRRSDVVLPSIERDIPNEHSDQISFGGEKRQVNPFGSYQPLSRRVQQLPAPSIIDLDDYDEAPSSKRRRIDDQQPISFSRQARTVLVPIEHIDDRQPWYERSHEAVYRDDRGPLVSDKRIVPLPPKGERARSPVDYRKLQQPSPHKQIMRHPDQVAEHVERFPQPRDHYQIPVSHSENVEGLRFPSRAKYAPPEYSDDSPSFLESSQFAPRRLESNGLGFTSRHDIRDIASSDQVYADSNGMTHRVQPLEVAERSMPSRFSDMSIDCRQRENDRRSDRVTYLPHTATADSHGRAMPSIAQDVLPEGIEPLTNAYPHDTPGRKIPRLPVQQQQQQQREPVLPIKQDRSLYHQLNHRISGPDRPNGLERRGLLPAPRVAVEPWNTNAQPNRRPLYEDAENRRPHSRGAAARPEYIRPFGLDQDVSRIGQRRRPDDFVVLD